jgi:hypothetical protein
LGGSAGSSIKFVRCVFDTAEQVKEGIVGIEETECTVGARRTAIPGLLIWRCRHPLEPVVSRENAKRWIGPMARLSIIAFLVQAGTADGRASNYVRLEYESSPGSFSDAFDRL